MPETQAGREPSDEGASTAAERRRHGRWRTAGAVLATAAVCVVMLIVLDGRKTDFATGIAERTVVLLDEGSRIELNAQTNLSVTLGRRERRVSFARGEALFTVAKDAARPFHVETPAGIVRVLGTVFNVRTTAELERVEVTVLEGSVRVGTTGEAVGETPLTAGGQVLLDGSDALSVRTLPEGAAQDAAAWRQGQVVFHDAPLREAIERFASYHAKEIIVDPSAAELRLGGRFALDDLNGLLDSLERVLPVHVVREAGGGWRIKGAPSKDPAR